MKLQKINDNHWRVTESILDNTLKILRLQQVILYKKGRRLDYSDEEHEMNIEKKRFRKKVYDIDVSKIKTHCCSCDKEHGIKVLGVIQNSKTSYKKYKYWYDIPENEEEKIMRYFRRGNYCEDCTKKPRLT